MVNQVLVLKIQRKQIIITSNSTVKLIKSAIIINIYYNQLGQAYMMNGKMKQELIDFII